MSEREGRNAKARMRWTEKRLTAAIAAIGAMLAGPEDEATGGPSHDDLHEAHQLLCTKRARLRQRRKT